MARSKDKSSTETLKAIVRKQRKVIEQLKKQAGRGDKVANALEEREIELAEALLEESTSDEFIQDNSGCPRCSKGKLEQVDLGIKKMVICDSCQFRQVRK